MGPQTDLLLHQEKVSGLLDDLGDVPLLNSCQTCDATWKDFTRVGHESGKDLNVCTGEFERILMALFLSCHKRHKEGLLNFLGKKKVKIPNPFG